MSSSSSLQKRLRQVLEDLRQDKITSRKVNHHILFYQTPYILNTQKALEDLSHLLENASLGRLLTRSSSGREELFNAGSVSWQQVYESVSRCWEKECQRLAKEGQGKKGSSSAALQAAKSSASILRKVVKKASQNDRTPMHAGQICAEMLAILDPERDSLIREHFWLDAVKILQEITRVKAYQRRVPPNLWVRMAALALKTITNPPESATDAGFLCRFVSWVLREGSSNTTGVLDVLRADEGDKLNIFKQLLTSKVRFTADQLLDIVEVSHTVTEIVRKDIFLPL